MCFRKNIGVGIVLLAIFTGVFSLFGFLPPEDTAGPLTLSIADPGEITVLGRPFRLNVTVRNAGSTKLDGTVRLAVIDDWRVEGGAPFSVGPKSSQSLSFNVTPGKGSYAA